MHGLFLVDGGFFGVCLKCVHKMRGNDAHLFTFNYGLVDYIHVRRSARTNEQTEQTKNGVYEAGDWECVYKCGCVSVKRRICE